jgi:hypothetical protein
MTMQQQLKPSIREVLLQEIHAQAPKGPMDSALQQSAVLDAAARKLAGFDHEAILTQWSELFRTGLLAWGFNLSNPNPPFFHLTDRGRQALRNLTRDPSNPDGYLRHLDSVARIGAVVRSYLIEGLDCYVAGLFKAAAVMTGAAAESIILDFRDVTVAKLNSLGKPVPKQMEDWRIKTVTDALRDFLDQHKSQLGPDLREPFEAYWTAFTLQIRAVRNDAGHPTSIDPVTPDTVHASLLIFPELARLADALTAWVTLKLT